MPLPSEPVSVAIGRRSLACVNDVDRAVTNYVEWGDLAWAHCDNLGVDKLEMIGAEEVAIREGATEEPPEVEEEAASEG